MSDDLGTGGGMAALHEVTTVSRMAAHGYDPSSLTAGICSILCIFRLQTLAIDCPPDAGQSCATLKTRFG